MAVYKVPQNVEAEDKLLGPFTPRQFIFLIIAAISGYLTFVLFRINPALIILTLPFFLVFGFLGVYRRADQPIEIYVFAVLRFFFKPHRRIWDKDGVLENVKITVPKRVVHHYTDGLSQDQVTSGLNILAQIMDTRGWSSKNVAVDEGANTMQLQSSDRLAMPIEQAIEPVAVHPSDDMMSNDSFVAQNVSAMSSQMSQQARAQAIEYMQNPPQVQPRQPVQNIPTSPNSQTLQSPVQAPVQSQQIKQSTNTLVQGQSPDIIRLSQNDDLNLTAIARQADQAIANDQQNMNQNQG